MIMMRDLFNSFAICFASVLPSVYYVSPAPFLPYAVLVLLARRAGPFGDPPVYIRVIGWRLHTLTSPADRLRFTLLWLSPFVGQPQMPVLYKCLNPVEYSIMHVLE